MKQGSLGSKVHEANMEPIWGLSPDSKVHGANMGPTWGRQDPGGPHVGPMNFAIWAWFNLCIVELIQVIIPIIKRGMKLHVNSQTSTV